MQSGSARLMTSYDGAPHRSPVIVRDCHAGHAQEDQLTGVCELASERVSPANMSGGTAGRSRLPWAQPLQLAEAARSRRRMERLGSAGLLPPTRPPTATPMATARLTAALATIVVLPSKQAASAARPDTIETSVPIFIHLLRRTRPGAPAPVRRPAVGNRVGGSSASPMLPATILAGHGAGRGVSDLSMHVHAPARRRLEDSRAVGAVVVRLSLSHITVLSAAGDDRPIQRHLVQAYQALQGPCALSPEASRTSA